VSNTSDSAPVNARQERRQNRERTRQRIIEAASELLRERSYTELNVNEIMERAGIGRTLFYRHFADLADLLLEVTQEAMDELYETQVALAEARLAEAGQVPDPPALRQALAVPVAVYSGHGPLLEAVLAAATVDPVVAERVKPLRERFDVLVAEFLERAGEQLGNPPANAAESARALNRLNEAYLVDAFGRGPRVSPEVATETLTEIWLAFVTRG
jgi:AcrR family transcriptional regulator